MIELSEIIENVNIVDYAEQYLELTKQPNGEYIGLCPFHSERSPSFTITPTNQLYYCFGCGAGGNVLNFIQKHHKCNFHRAVQLLKEYADISDDVTTTTKLTSTNVIKKYKFIGDKKKQKEHIVLEPNIMSKYEKNASALKAWEDEGISKQVLEKYQVRYDPFSNRIVFPVRDYDGTIINVKGRTIDSNFKEKRIPKYTNYYELGQNDFIYGYYEHYQHYINQKEIILFEGEKSVMKCEGWGIYNTGALSTSHLDSFQFKILLKLGVRVVFALDKHVDIRKDKEISKLKRYVPVQYIYDKNNLLAEKDAPVDKGLEVWNTLYEGRYNLN